MLVKRGFLAVTREAMPSPSSPVESPPPTSPPTAASRLAAIDTLRGFIMVVMAIDHASAFIAQKHGSEFWTGPHTRYPTADFVSRTAVVSIAIHHPSVRSGFFFLMGAGMSLFAASRRRIGWDEARITRYFALRGCRCCCSSTSYLKTGLAAGLCPSRHAKRRPGRLPGLFGHQRFGDVNARRWPAAAAAPRDRSCRPALAGRLRRTGATPAAI